MKYELFTKRYIMARIAPFLVLVFFISTVFAGCEGDDNVTTEDTQVDEAGDTQSDALEVTDDGAGDGVEGPQPDAEDTVEDDGHPDTSPDIAPDEEDLRDTIEDIPADDGGEPGEVRGYIRLEERPGNLAAPTAFFAGGPLPEPWAAVLDPVPGCAVHRMEGYPSVEMPETVNAGMVNLDGIADPPLWLFLISGDYVADPYDPFRYDLFAPGALLTATVEGGSGIPRIAVSNHAPGTDFSLTSPGMVDYRANGIDTSSELQVTWHGGDGDFVEIVITREHIDHFGADTFTQLQCTAPDTGSFTLPASTMGELPATFTREGLIVRRVKRTSASAEGVAVMLDITSAASMSREAFENPCTPGEVRCVGTTKGTCLEDGTWSLWDCSLYDPTGDRICRECSDGTAACVSASASRPCDADTFEASCDGDTRLSSCVCDVVIERPCAMGLSCFTCDYPWPDAYCTDGSGCSEWFFEPYCSGSYAYQECACGQPTVEDCAADDPFGVCCEEEFMVYCSIFEC